MTAAKQSPASDTQEVSRPQTSSAAGVRWRPPLVILLLAALGIACALWVLGPGVRFWVSTGITVLGVVAFMVWVRRFSRLPRSWRWIGFFTPIVLAAGFFSLFRIEEFDGDSVPVPSSVTPRWKPRPAERMAAVAVPTISTDIRLVASEHDYPQFQGPQRDGIVRGIKLSRDWQAHGPREVWRREIGAGWSGFAVVGDFAFTQELRGAVEVVACYRLQTGDPLWVFQDEEGYQSRQFDGTGPRATPTVEAGHMYVMGGAGKVNCLDASTGQRIWQRHVLQEFGATNCMWGKADSPLVVGDLVVVTGGGTRGPSLIALDRETGKIAWSAAWSEKQQGTIGDAYASPVLATLCGVRQILNQEDLGVASYDPRTGQQLWRLDWPWPNQKHAKISQPMPLPGDRVFISAEYGSGGALIQVRSDEQGTFSAEPLWKRETLRTKFSNAVRRGDHLYGLQSGVLRCINWETGDLVWKGGHYGHGQILLVDDLILVESERPGDISLVEASPDAFRELGRAKALDTTTWNTMALAGKYLLVRNDREAACFELTLAKQ